MGFSSDHFEFASFLIPLFYRQPTLTVTLQRHKTALKEQAVKRSASGWLEGGHEATHEEKYRDNGSFYSSAIPCKDIIDCKHITNRHPSGMALKAHFDRLLDPQY